MTNHYSSVNGLVLKSNISVVAHDSTNQFVPNVFQLVGQFLVLNPSLLFVLLLFSLIPFFLVSLLFINLI
jgi:hypothetical protein